MRIYLIGFMGSGKSHVGKRLARMLNWQFVDMDEYLEQQEGRTISDIFATDGADEFRRLEQQYLQASTQWDNIVIATGGGAPCFFDNMAWMQRNGLTIYLQTPVQILAERLEYGMEHRPLLRGKTFWELKEFIRDKLAEREAFYMQAAVVYDVKEVKQKVAEELFRELNQIIGH
ncbi:MAG: shikimate kinase [Saprospiraceae bacterium]